MLVEVDQCVKKKILGLENEEENLVRVHRDPSKAEANVEFICVSMRCLKWTAPNDGQVHIELYISANQSR